jgi:hypothetical protein
MQAPKKPSSSIIKEIENIRAVTSKLLLHLKALLAPLGNDTFITSKVKQNL